MKLQYQLWVIFSFLFAGIGLLLYLFIADTYKEKVLKDQEALAVSQGLTILERITGAYPKQPQRVQGYLDYYSDHLDMRLFLISEENKVLYDSFHLVPKASLSLEILTAKDETPVSSFAFTDAYGHVQYTLLAMNERKPYTIFLLMIKDANPLYASIRSFERTIFVFMGFAVLLFFLFSYFIASWFTKPIRNIISSMRLISPHKRHFEVNYTRRDEIKDLVDAIQTMINQLNFYEQSQRQFLSASSHELKTPIATMQLIAENLPSVRQDQAIHDEFMSDFSFQLNKMKQMVDNILNVNRLWDKPLIKKPLNVLDIETHIRKHFQHAAEYKHLQLQFFISDATIYVDHDLFLRGIDNLVSNAIRYSPEGKIVKIGMSKPTAEQLQFSVCDQGIGIDNEDLPYIFEAFYRSKEATDWDQQGSGLGLWIVKQMVDYHGGEIKVQTKPGHGTCMILLFRNNIVTPPPSS